MKKIVTIIPVSYTHLDVYKRQTKRGTSGKLEVTGRATMKISHIKRLPEYLGAYDYALLANEARARCV